MNGNETNLQETNNSKATNQQQVYGQSVKSAKRLPENRGAIKAILFTVLTLGIYQIVMLTKMGEELNITASKYDGKRTMNYCLLSFIVAPLTLGLGWVVWSHKFSARIGNELERRNINYSFGAGSYWLWNVLGILILVGPFVYLHKLVKAVNLINEDYNTSSDNTTNNNLYQNNAQTSTNTQPQVYSCPNCKGAVTYGEPRCSNCGTEFNWNM